MTQKRLQVTRGAGPGGAPISGNLDAVYSYDSEGKVSSFSYPNPTGPYFGTASQYFVNTFDAMSRPMKVTEWRTNGVGFPSTVVADWASGAAYGPANEMTGMSYRTSSGSVYNETRSYNSRVQLTNLTASGSGLQGVNFNYIYPAQNNGKLLKAQDVLSGEEVTYTYDSLLRLINAQTTDAGNPAPWSQSYSYDAFGNRTSAGSTSINYDAATNRIQTDATHQYDANGNLTLMPYGGGAMSLVYDVENRLKQAGTDQYAYGFRNERVWKSGTGEIYFYGVYGEKLGSYQMYPSQSSFIITTLSTNLYFGGKLIRSNGQTVVTDRLGSVRANEAGERFKYYPYGEEFQTTAQNREKFGTYYRDDGTGLDYAGGEVLRERLRSFHGCGHGRCGSGEAAIV